MGKTAMNNYPTTFLDILQKCTPDACANIIGNNDYSDLNGNACFYDTKTGGTLVEVEVFGLPVRENENPTAFYGMHIHENGDCTPPFDKTGEHFNPDDDPHPMHAGDMPALLGNNGYAYMVFYTERYSVSDIVDRSIVIHLMPDDYKTQPSGNSGEKIGCGIIMPCTM